MKWGRISFLDWVTLGRPCVDCWASLDSDRHHAECVAPLDQIEGDA